MIEFKDIKTLLRCVCANSGRQIVVDDYNALNAKAITLF